MKTIFQIFGIIFFILAINFLFISIFITSKIPNNSTEIFPAKEKQEFPIPLQSAESQIRLLSPEQERAFDIAHGIKATPYVAPPPIQAEVKPAYSASNPNPDYIAWNKREKEPKAVEPPSVSDYISFLEERKKREIAQGVKFIETENVINTKTNNVINTVKEIEPKIDERYKWFNDPLQNTSFLHSNIVADSARLNKNFVAFDNEEEKGAWYYTKNTMYYTVVTIGIISILPAAIAAAAASSSNGSFYGDDSAPSTTSSGYPVGSLENRGFVRTGATSYVKPNAYGLGTGMNQFGGAVKTVPAY